MSELVRTFTITVGKVYNGEFECRHPKVDLVDSAAVVNCIDRRKGIYRVQILNDQTSDLVFEVKCDDVDCDVCETQTIVKRFCDVSSDCGSNEFCDPQGFCSSIVGLQFGSDGDVISGGIECDSSKPCPGNKICQNGRCVCPVGTFEDGIYCSDCRGQSDCEVCETCESNGQYKECKTKDCVCNSLGECVECTNSGHCGQNEVCNEGNTCECAPDSFRIGGICTVIECREDDDCEDCEICNGIECNPIQCPAGKTLQIVNNICSCVETCVDCDEEECKGSCETGLDCGKNCGCKDYQCVSCSGLGCGACETALGCVCEDQICEPDGCNNTTCVTPFECGYGCTCVQGLCESCSNYSAEDCDKPGCTAVGGKCVEDPNGPTSPDPECGDTTTITKNDDCTITGSVVKTSCCSASPLTIDSFISKVGNTGSNKKVDFTVELRKGVFSPTSQFANPLLSNTSNSEIAENEQPLYGTVSIVVATTYSVTSSGSLVGLTTDAATTYTLPIGGKASVTFPNIPIYSVGFSITNGTEVKTVTKTTVEVIHSGSLGFENLSVYDSVVKVGTFVFDDNSGFTVKYPAIGTTIFSDICRKPFLSWTKSADTTFNEQPFRKIYGETDTITPEEGAESCFNYQLESDCNCNTSATAYIVFCSPDTFPKPVLSNCGKSAEIQIDPSCAANWDKTYELYLNDVKADSFTLNEAYSKTLTSTTAISSLTLKLKCDTAGQCDITHTYDVEELESDPVTVCNGETFTATWAEEGLTKVEYGLTADLLSNVVTATNGTAVISNLESGVTYYYRLTYTTCISAVGSFVVDCPLASKPVVECNSDGTFTISNMEDSGVYTLSDFEVSEDLAEEIITPNAFGEYVISEEESTTAKTLTYDVNGISGEITIPAYSSSDCCSIIYSYWVEDLVLYIVVAEANFPVVVQVNDVTPQTATASGQELVFTLPEEGTYVVTLISDDSPSCEATINIGDVQDCEMSLNLTPSFVACNYVAVIEDPTPCHCDGGYMTVDQVTIGDLGDSMVVSYKLTVSLPNYEPDKNQVVSSTILGEDVSLVINEAFSGEFNIDLECYDGDFPCDNCGEKIFDITIELEDGCEYTSYLVLNLCKDDYVYGETYQANLITSSVRDIQLDWRVNGDLVKTQYETGVSPTFTLTVDEGDIEPGDTVLGTAICGCTDSDTTSDCLSTTISDIEVGETNTSVSFTLETCYPNSVITVSVYDCDDTVVAMVSTLAENLTEGHEFFLGDPLCVGESKITYSYGGGFCGGEVLFTVVALPSTSASVSPSSSRSSSASSSRSSSVSPSSSLSSSISPSSSASSSLSPSSSISTSVSPSASISSSPSASLSPSVSISSSPSTGSSPSSSVSSSLSPSSSTSASVSPSSSISSSESSSRSSSISSSVSPSSSRSSSESSSVSPSSSASSSVSPSQSISNSPSSSASSSISSSPSVGSSPSSSVSSSLSRSSSRSSSASSSRSASISRSPSRSVSSSLSRSSSRSDSVSSSISSSISSSVSPSSSRSSSRSASISNSPSSSRSSSVSPSSSRSSSVSPSSSRSASISSSPSRSVSSSRSSSISSSISSSPSPAPCTCGPLSCCADSTDCYDPATEQCCFFPT